MELEGVALVIGSILTPTSVVVIGWFTTRRISEVNETAIDTLRQIDEVNHAVNGRGGRRTTIEQDVDTIMARQELDAPSEIHERGLVQIVEELLAELKKANGRPKGDT